MKPLFLSIEGLQSFQEKQTIDFEKIGRDGLFGIFGPTGSGKSTIIDGMTLALYGSIVRFKDKASETKDSFDIEAVNKNSDHACVNFKFKVGENIYRAERNYKIGKKSGKLSKTAVLFKTEEDGSEIKIAENYKDIYHEIKENILGLTLEDFTRSVVLPQGNFSQFLKLDGREKRDMLERIFNLEKYGDILSKKANSCKYTLESKIKELDIELSSIGFNEEELILKEAELKKSEEELAELKEKESRIKEQISEMEEIEKLEIKLFDLNRKKSELDSQKAEIEKLEEKTVLSEKFIPVIEKIHKRNDYEEKMAELNKSITEIQENFKLAKKMLEDEQKKYNELEILENQKETEKGENYISQEEFSKISDDYRDAVKKSELSNKIFEIKKETEKLNCETEKILFEIKTAENEKNKLEKEKSEIKEISQNEIFALEKAELEKTNILKYLRENEREIFELEKNIKGFQKELENKTVELSEKEEQEKKYFEQREKYFVYELRKNLHSGDICPVCNKLYEHEQTAENKNIGFERENFENIQREISFLNSSILSLKEKIKESETKTAELKEKIKDISILERDIFEIKSERDVLQKQLNEISEKKSYFEIKIKEFISKINELNISYNRYESELFFKKNISSEMENELKNIPETDCTKEVLKNRLEELKEKSNIYKNIEKELSEIRKKKKDIYDNKIIKWTEKIREKEKEVIQKEQNYENLKSDYLILNREIEKVLLENKISDLKELAEIEKYIDNVEEMKSAVKDYKDRSIIVLNGILDVQNELKDRSFSKEEFEKLIECGKIIKISLEKNNQIIGEIRKSIEIFNLNKNRAEKLLERKKELEKELDPAKELAKLLEGRKFLDFLSAGKLQSITRTASNTLQKITNGRYRINVDEKSDFSIIDNFNSSVRKPQSLSGGETFMVSLCLALALADQIQLRGKSRLEFFFLDEGFGTLDSELLEIVFGVLENLKSEGMTVGIITHVEEIKNRVARKLLVTPAKIGESGTVVKEI